jgi:hypothetical protein
MPTRMWAVLADVREQANGGRLPVGAGDRDDGDARRLPVRIEHAHDRLGDVARRAAGRMEMHAQPGCGVHLDDGAALLGQRPADVVAEHVDPGDVESENLRGQLGQARVVGMHECR